MSNTPKNVITITVSDSVLNELKELGLHMRDNPTIEEITTKTLEQGLTQLSYRYGRNERMWQKAKRDKVLLAELLADKARREEEGK